jgi:hypothetical protein
MLQNLTLLGYLSFENFGTMGRLEWHSQVPSGY